MGQGRRHAPGHHRPGLSLLRGLRDARQRSGRPVADGPGGHVIAGGDHRDGSHLPADRPLHVRGHRLLHGLHVAQRIDVDGCARLDADGGRPDRHPPGGPGRHLPRPGNRLDGRLQRRVGDGHRAPAARLRLPDRLDLLGHRGRPSPRPAVTDRLDLVGQRWRWRHLGDVRRLPVRQPDLGRRRHRGRPRDLPDRHRPMGQGRRHAPGHHGPGLSLLRGLRDARQRSGRPVAGGPGGHFIAGGDRPGRFPPTCRSAATRPGAPSTTRPTRRPTGRRGRRCPARRRRWPA